MMRKNIDYGPATLPMGEMLEFKNASPVTVATEIDVARFTRILSNPLSFPQENHQGECEVQKLAPLNDTFNEMELSKYLEQTCRGTHQNAHLEISLKVAEEILPETWVNIRKTKDGLHIEFECTSDETRHWLQSISTRLSSRLKDRLLCLVDVTVNDGRNFTYQMDQGDSTKDARHI